MESSTSDAHTHVEPGPSSVVPPRQPLKIRWGRTAIALVGLLALLTAGISGALSVISIGSSTLPLLTLGTFALVIVLLRVLAMRDAAIRRAARLEARTTAEQASSHASPAPVEQKETALFDGAEGAEPAPAPKPLTAEELRAAAMRVAAKGAADAKLADTQTLAETWDPVEVPVPGYVKAAKALTLDKPLNLPAAPKSAGTSIKADLAGVGAGDGVAAVPDLQEVPASAGATAAAVKAGPGKAPAAEQRGTYALNNLDDVLQRRRA
ncbi:hypothetical protein JOF48_002222 [Arthrobacter stackebrandtii]|uniref:DUF308 domain-containing protein n=1 Tax=Arthrobacter stackebrandtii TaxID=272161 RepID=A0ABS4YXB5_9MICC|nr:hypothetical protein [Arthrobacter stackebrandtii]MBP2413423.1 hypothetical protein [Arthrobacter stackebrandtii]PYH00725.1 hypothetical protein CVV67_09445 [Arthrobacter stackebrandtii]